MVTLASVATVPHTVTLTLTRGRLLAVLKACAPFMCEDPTRFHIATISLEVVKCPSVLRVVATDGHTLAKAEIPLLDARNPMSQTVIKADDVRSMIKALAHKRKEADKPCELRITEAGGVTLTIDTTQATYTAFDQSEAKYPKYEQVIPGTPDAASVKVGINPAYLARASDAVKAFGREDDSPRGASMTIGKELDPVKLAWESPECGEFVAVIMPMRL